MDIVTKHSFYIPRPLEPGVLHVSWAFGIALHICPCGCKEGVVTPLWEGQWALTEVDNRPTLSPLINNAQTCKAHYWV